MTPSASAFVFTDTTTAMCSTQVKSVLLQTARALVCSPARPDSPIQMRVLLDSSSQQSYLTERTMKMLSLAPVGEQQLSIAAFGTTRGVPKVCPIVRVAMVVHGSI